MNDDDLKITYIIETVSKSSADHQLPKQVKKMSVLLR